MTAGQALQNNALPAINAGQPAPVGYPNHETNGLAEINIQRIQYIRTHGGSRNCLPLIYSYHVIKEIMLDIQVYTVL